MGYSDSGKVPLPDIKRPQKSSARSTTLSLIIGTGGIMVTGIQPLLLGSLHSQGILTPNQLGLAGAVEIFSLAAGIVIGSRLLSDSASRWYVVLAGIVMAMANVGTAKAGIDWQVITLRLIAGIAEGVLIAVVMLAISYSPRPERLGGLFLSVSGPPSLVLAYALPGILNPAMGWNAGFTIMAGIGILCAIAGAAHNSAFAPNRPTDLNKIMWNRPIILALAATLLANAAFGACWTYVEPLAVLRGIRPVVIGQIVMLAIACQISGSLAVALSGRHFRALPFLKCASVFQIGAVLFLLTARTEIEFAIALGALSFFWQASAPCAIALITALDETRATAPLTFPLQLVGLSIGPLAAATGASSSLSYPYILGLLMLTLAGIFLVMVGRARGVVPDLRA